MNFLRKILLFGCAILALTGIFHPKPVAGQTDIPATGLRLWLSADAGVTADQGGRISLWRDQSGADNDATQGSGGNQPLLIPNSLAGLPTVRFTGSEWLNLPDVMNEATAGEIFVVLKGEDMPVVERGMMSFGGGDPSYYPWLDGQVYENFGSTVRHTLGNPSQALDQHHIYDVSSQSGEWTARINGLPQFQTAVNQVYFPATPLIGRTSSGYNFAGDIAEIIVYDRVLNGAERQTVEYYLGGKYPVIAPLPATPTTLQATAIAPSQVSLSWNYDLGNVATEFEVDRKIGAGAYTAIAIVAHATSYLDLSASGGITYTYRVRAINYSGQSSYSNEASATTPLSGDPFPIAGMRLWLKADSGTSNPLTIWSDQSGNSNDAVQTSFVNRPAIAANSINGRPSVHFTGNEWLNLPDVMNGGTAGEIFVVLKGEDTTVVERGMMSFGGGDASFYPWLDGQVYENFGSTVRYTIGDPSLPLDQYHIYDVSSESGEWAARINGLLQFQTTGNEVLLPQLSSYWSEQLRLQFCRRYC